MSASEQSRIRTRMFARVMGPYLTIVPTTVAIRGSYMQELFNEFKANPMWAWLYGAILLMGGLFIIAFHQYWRGLAAIIVSAVGWFFLIRGVLLLTVPRAYDSAGNAIYNSGASAAIWVLFICLASAGLYLTYVGWKPETQAPESISGTTQDRPGAAGS
ncbi:MAG: hypothetical protein JOZ00_15905 [Mycobacterium sp.]|uniref:hypothetical protein n=1 Tax=Mycobacterium sp. TaxID=1785 RepID=UPI001EC45804|nr:hypothetical protein [Mycobacterium sp.]MBV8788160.1 hypothetical protein [Mycobacterium sp.]